MGATTIMIIRHAEKSGTYDGIDYRGVNPSGAEDKESLAPSDGNGRAHWQPCFRRRGVVAEHGCPFPGRCLPPIPPTRANRTLKATTPMTSPVSAPTRR